MSKRDLFGIVPIGVLADVLLNGADLLLLGGELLFTPLAITAGTIAPNVPYLDQGLFTSLTVVAATLYVLSMIDKRYERFKEETN